jgi:septum formation protein
MTWLMERMIHPIIGPMRIVLASASPRRAELLRAAGYAFETLVVDLDESLRPGDTPETYVRRLAMEKSAQALAAIETSNRTSSPDDPEGIADIVVLGADTTVVVDDTILGKPRDDGDARSMLRRLSGRTHRVLTGISLRFREQEVGRVESTTVEFSVLGETDIEWYVTSGEGRDKAGAYAIQGLASRFIPRIDGSYSNVVGLPLAAVHELVAEIASQPFQGYSNKESFPRKSL